MARGKLVHFGTSQLLKAGKWRISEMPQPGKGPNDVHGKLGEHGLV
tara:strand:+ start:2095 stop:2232 length:138 start_codon:yes stop_codon:yes gene_type:complete